MQERKFRLRKLRWLPVQPVKPKALWQHSVSMTRVSSLACAALLICASGAGAQGVTGNVQAGAQKTAMCSGCHGIDGYQSSFPELYKVPKIAGQNQVYLYQALLAYQKGERKHPTMRGIAVSLSEQDMADLSAYYAQANRAGRAPAAAAPQNPPAPSAAVTALLNQGACVSCHGTHFSNSTDPSYPKLAGQYASYLYAALKSYKTENSPYIGRSNAIMTGMAKPYTLSDLKLIAEYISSLPGELETEHVSPLR